MNPLELRTSDPLSQQRKMEKGLVALLSTADQRLEPRSRPGLYVHVPFCLRKCDYCAFYSIPSPEPGLTEAYLTGLAEEVLLRRRDAPEGVSSLFVGGGTPTALPAEGLKRMFEILGRSFRLVEGSEQSVEANPGTLSPEKLRLLRRVGINRISLGAQSFSDQLLRSLGRIHRVEEINKGVRMARAAGFSNLNLDLMFGLPDQTLKLWQNTLQEAVALTPEHLSLYALSLEEGTPLAKRYASPSVRPADPSPPFLPFPDDDLQADMYDWAGEYLEKAGYLHYEVSNFALPGRECRHNLAVWRGEEYLGLGPGAVSTLSGVRWRNVEDVAGYAKYLAQGHLPLSPEGTEVLSPRERRGERLILGLRLKEGVSLSAFRSDFGSDLRDIYAEALERYLRQGVLVWAEGFLRLNPKYAFVANSILKDFV